MRKRWKPSDQFPNLSKSAPCGCCAPSGTISSDCCANALPTTLYLTDSCYGSGVVMTYSATQVIPDNPAFNSVAGWLGVQTWTGDWSTSSCSPQPSQVTVYYLLTVIGCNLRIFYKAKSGVNNCPYVSGSSYVQLTFYYSAYSPNLHQVGSTCSPINIVFQDYVGDSSLSGNSGVAMYWPCDLGNSSYTVSWTITS